MSPKFYSFLWLLYFVSAGVVWLGNVFTMLAVVIFGSIAFGMVFMGMMCVLPGAISHPAPEKAKPPKPEKAIKQAPGRRAKAASGFSAYRSV